MRHEEIEKIFTDKVLEYIAKGYVMNLGTMSGSQGEIGKVDLRKGDDVIRILLCSDRKWGRYDENKFYECGSVDLIVGRNTDELRRGGDPFDSFNTIWNNHLEIIEKRVFYKIKYDCDYFIEDLEEIKRMCEVRYSRWERRDSGEWDVENQEKARSIVLPFVNRQSGCKGKKVSDIEAVKKAANGYVVELKNGKSFRLKSRCA